MTPASLPAAHSQSPPKVASAGTPGSGLHHMKGGHRRVPLDRAALIAPLGRKPPRRPLKRLAPRRSAV
jgi:hypothetical protein